MNLLKALRTNWKYILIVATLALVVIGVILSWDWAPWGPGIIKFIQIQMARNPEEKCKLAGDFWRSSKNCCCPKICLIAYYLPGKEPPECLCCHGLYEELEEETVNWKTYRNEEYGFEIKYPDEATILWELKLYDGEIQPLVIDFPSSQYGTNVDLAVFTVNIQDITSNVCINTARFYSQPGVVKEIIKINEVEFKKTIDVTGGTETSGYGIEYFATKGDKCFLLRFQLTGRRYPTPASFDTEKTSEVSNQMLSTFRFLE